MQNNDSKLSDSRVNPSGDFAHPVKRDTINIEEKK